MNDSDMEVYQIASKVADLYTFLPPFELRIPSIFHVSSREEDLSAKDVTNGVGIAVVNVGIGMSLKPCRPE